MKRYIIICSSRSLTSHYKFRSNQIVTFTITKKLKSWYFFFLKKTIIRFLYCKKKFIFHHLIWLLTLNTKYVFRGGEREWESIWSYVVVKEKYMYVILLCCVFCLSKYTIYEFFFIKERTFSSICCPRYFKKVTLYLNNFNLLYKFKTLFYTLR